MDTAKPFAPTKLRALWRAMCEAVSRSLARISRAWNNLQDAVARRYYP